MEIENRYSLFLPQKEVVSLSDKAELSRMCRESAIRVGNVSVVSLPGVVSDVSEYLKDGRQLWAADPLPGFEKLVSDLNVENLKTFELGPGGASKLWEYMSKTGERLSRETGEEVILEFLTPGQAVILVAETIKDTIFYEDLISRVVEESLEAGEPVRTAYPEILALYKTDIEKFRSEVNRLDDELDQLTADQLLERGSGVCRHIAVAASVMYEVLKVNQMSTMLNGTYLISHSENIGSQSVKSVVGGHTYNILVMMQPSKEVEITILDFTEMISDPNGLDETGNRISQTCSFLSEFGPIFVEGDVDKAVEGIAREAYTRMAKYFDRKKLPLSAKKGVPPIDSYLGDYISLVDQGAVGKTGGTIKHMTELLGIYGCSRIKALNMVLGTAAYSYDNDGSATSVRSERITELNYELSTVDFSRRQDEDLQRLWEIMGSTLLGRDNGWFDSLERGELLALSNGNMDFIGYYVKATLEMEREIADESILWVVDKAIDIVQDNDLGCLLYDLGNDFREKMDIE